MNVDVVVGGQYGSEGKGAVTARLCRERHYSYAVRVGGPNAGHTVVHGGKKYALRQLPVAAVVDPDTVLVIAAGSEVDPAVLWREVAMLEADGIEVRHRLRVDQEATHLSTAYAAEEATLAVKGRSTGKGVGAARAARAMRRADRMLDMLNDFDSPGVVDTQRALREAVRGGEPVMLEGTQGYGLGTHAGRYPHCTSGDCRATDMIAMAGLPPGEPGRVWLVLRSHPIRIAGDSGPLHCEMTWEALGVEPEYTTVTQKKRRVGEWDWRLAAESVGANRCRGLRLALTFVDYWEPSVRGMDGRLKLPESVGERVHRIEDELDVPVGMVGTGPDTQILRGLW